MMDYRIETLPETQLIGVHMTVSIINNKTRELWKSFMPRRKEILKIKTPDLYSIQVYDSTDYFSQFDPHRSFEEWAGVAVTSLDNLPKGMEALVIPAGLYAVFTYQGKSSSARDAYIYIFGTWLPGSDYELADRPHLAIMGEKYNNDDPDSEEEIWIPVKVID